MGKLFEIRVTKENERVFIVLAENKEHAQKFFKEYSALLHYDQGVKVGIFNELPNWGSIMYDEPISILIAE